ncbi:bifunctional 4-hydroxy-3-methylbut-2-enyl diphosphate reductase/30S ribosomal protein S1 [Clostridium botulinum]|uniref:bifunctional 4-hydroxy-3-methylbut-2-enyl diphosphate reductase/30S ribosomal protein S1 n=1 Tax=Clostridium botulinum TaxID=1491 RepID=UPI0001F84DE6|nr:bifunctional 4-hydroxy-3-methylbut-2-enyl diphosphate reductase/30S ribosomal protein S1 [Clostridium botulinum]NFB18606.1 bifunctional 4-hydroxy-3-methylbut-2-enyl diphosphate reductase/30S ribosomal protein S1 [Clostridium botulinum]NFB69473.1 bifunctional 4-hydroxy-3-methylbut-2-enyl diphosphate reductase/30S ribosomal protein S1 [Clostridium botulinum]NFB99338.1 bifunctional 4-hydroxy-3-methylbut-2-enyl diphosphate reductase/30S ribosomal protein S1 [Clostridium botulinum]NFC49058.1 bifu
MNVILADKAGFCFGVKRALDTTINTKENLKGKIYTLGPLIHNNDVVNLLKGKGIEPISIQDVDKLNKDDTIIIRSHGVPLQTINYLKDKGLNVINTTCPHVANIQIKAKKYYEEGYKIVIVGDENHPEVIGINGWCNNSAIISKDGANINNLDKKVCVLCQTTEKQENWEKVLTILIKNSREILAFNTICNATQVRQQSAKKLSEKVDSMIVIGGKNSSNTTKLYEICKSNCKNTIHVENAKEIPEHIYKNSNIIGVTAGASTPDWIIKEAINKMNNNDSIIEVSKNEMLNYMNEKEQQIVVGKVVKGTIVSLNENELFVDLNYKSEGIIPKEEVTLDEESILKESFKVGDKIEAKIVRIKNEDGYVVLSLKELHREKALKNLKEAFDNKQTIKVIVKDAVDAGLICIYNGVRVFIPASHIELSHVDDLEAYKGLELEVNIIEFIKDRYRTKIVGSRRNILKIIRNKHIEETWNSLEKDTVVEGEVKRFTDFGAFIEINGVDGLLHVSEISWGRVEKPEDALKIGDKIKVYILDIDKENKKLALSIKKLIEDPWKSVEIKYPIGNIVLGKVVRFANFGAFIELEPGVDGLVHISKISNKRIDKPEEELTLGKEVKAKILEVNSVEKRIALSIKDVEEF